MNELQELQSRLLSVLRLTAEEVRPCRACGRELYFVRHRATGKIAPYTAEGINHFIDCPMAKSFKQGANR